MGIFEKLAEARIREWQERSRPQSTAPSRQPVAPTTDTLEVQLLNDIVALRERITNTTDSAERQALSKTAHELEVRLMILLEQSGRPLAAQQLSERLSKNR